MEYAKQFFPSQPASSVLLWGINLPVQDQFIGYGEGGFSCLQSNCILKGFSPQEERYFPPDRYDQAAWCSSIPFEHNY